MHNGFKERSIKYLGLQKTGIHPVINCNSNTKVCFLSKDAANQGLPQNQVRCVWLQLPVSDQNMPAGHIPGHSNCFRLKV